jgi:hypothetical protein
LPGCKSDERKVLESVEMYQVECTTGGLDQPPVHIGADVVRSSILINQPLCCLIPAGSVGLAVGLGMTVDNLQDQHEAGLFDKIEIIRVDGSDVGSFMGLAHLLNKLYDV